MVLVTKDDFGECTIMGSKEMTMDDIGYVIGMTIEEIIECQFVKEGEADYDAIFTELQSKYCSEEKGQD
ncbi:hypothetical protein [Bacillus phage vB_Bpu_PumA1]|uniref:Uncharacterized protein n=1 Tax=Bacillus phage vB_Bpu_PumA1 TaxID=2662127 RepID=A0A5Q2W7M9_9CAUD|nr:hypothetical protein H3020_gp04 [Bacillus phage vB_Bpu_PumA1]QGH74197.1 hypothetical protein [Bacillus phage vB_Bpu_PumA1]